MRFGGDTIVAVCLAVALLVIVVGLVLATMARFLKCSVSEVASAVSEVLAVVMPVSRNSRRSR